MVGLLQKTDVFRFLFFMFQSYYYCITLQIRLESKISRREDVENINFAYCI
jgi:hypothetical protein